MKRMEKLISTEQGGLDFRKVNLVLMIFFSFITLGAYIGIWFLKQREMVEQFPAKLGIHFGLWKLSTIASFGFLFIQIFGGMILSDYGLDNFQSYETIFNFFFVGLLYYSIIRLKEGLENEFDFTFNFYLVVLFHIFYIQFKLNQSYSASTKFGKERME